MEVREAREADIPAIVDLLKLSLGESLMPKSERYWRWKHQENPFGPSPVLVCFDGNTLIGVRAFMRWEWTDRNQVFRALRAVDTATHPSHQGKGIFKKLTLALVDLCKDKNDHFIFNTPNQQSKPGYIKMGWEEAGKLPIAVSVQRPFRMLKNLFGPIDVTKIESSKLSYYFQHQGMEALIANASARETKISTKVSMKYLTWRYENVPVAEYVAVGDEEKGELLGLVIGRIKVTRLGRELRITDCLLNEKSENKKLLEKLNAYKKEAKIDYCTFTGTPGEKIRQILGPYYLRASFGPMVTVRALSLDKISPLKNYNEWSPSLGDLELF